LISSLKNKAEQKEEMKKTTQIDEWDEYDHDDEDYTPTHTKDEIRERENKEATGVDNLKKILDKKQPIQQKKHYNKQGQGERKPKEGSGYGGPKKFFNNRGNYDNKDFNNQNPHYNQNPNTQNSHYNQNSNYDRNSHYNQNSHYDRNSQHNHNPNYARRDKDSDRREITKKLDNFANIIKDTERSNQGIKPTTKTYDTEPNLNRESKEELSMPSFVNNRIGEKKLQRLK